MLEHAWAGGVKISPEAIKPKAPMPETSTPPTAPPETLPETPAETATPKVPQAEGVIPSTETPPQPETTASPPSEAPVKTQLPTEMQQQPPEVKIEAPIEKIIEYQGGKSIWQEAGKQWESRFKEFADLGGGDSKAAEALKTYNIDRIKDTVVDAIKSGDKNLIEKYGLVGIDDPDKLTVDQLKDIKWGNIFDDTLKEKGLVESLPAEQVESIVKNNASLREFFKEYPSAPRTSENYEAILKGRGATGEQAPPVETITEIKKTPAEPRPEVKSSAEIVEPATKPKPIAPDTPEPSKAPEIGTEEFYQAQQTLENTSISPGERMANINEASKTNPQRIETLKDFLKKPGLSPETKTMLGQEINDLEKYQAKLTKLTEAKGVEIKQLFIKELLPPKVMEPGEFQTIINKSFTELTDNEKLKMDKLFIKYLEHDFETFKSLSDYSQIVKIREAASALNELGEQIKTAPNIAQKAFAMRNAGELKMVGRIWNKFGLGK